MLTTRFKEPVLGLVLAALLCACTTAPSPRQRALIVSDLQDAITVAAPLLGEENGEYIAALRRALDAFAAAEETNWVAAFDAIYSLEPLVRSKLIAQGLTPQEAEAVLALTHIPLRHLELFLVESGEVVGPPMPAGGVL
jgi:hypothetical protein